MNPAGAVVKEVYVNPCDYLVRQISYLDETGVPRAVVKLDGYVQVDPMFSGSKIRWILEHTEDGFRRAEQGELCAGNIDACSLFQVLLHFSQHLVGLDHLHARGIDTLRLR